MPATEFNKTYVTLSKLAIFISEKLTPCFFASARYHDEICNEASYQELIASYHDETMLP